MERWWTDFSESRTLIDQLELPVTFVVSGKQVIQATGRRFERQLLRLIVWVDARQAEMIEPLDIDLEIVRHAIFCE